MLKIEKIVGLFSFSLLLSCGIKPSSPINLNDQVRLRGYNTGCNGKLLFIDSMSQQISSNQTLKAGPLEVKVFYESPAMATVHEAFFCFHDSEHLVKFNAQPNKTYRFYAENVSPKRYSITAYEYINPRLPEAKPVPTTSEQFKISERCNFAPISPNCEAIRIP